MASICDSTWETCDSLYTVVSFQADVTANTSATSNDTAPVAASNDTAPVAATTTEPTPTASTLVWGLFEAA
jgi:hypothetical protein